MSNAATANLFWGICAEYETDHWSNLGRDYNDPNYVEDPPNTEWDEVYAQRMGVSKPNIPYDDHNPQVQETYKGYWKAKKEIAKASGCDIGYYGCGDSDQLSVFVAIKESKTKAYWDSPTYLEQNRLEVQPEWREKLQKFCEVMGIKWQEPKWCLVAYYG